MDCKPTMQKLYNDLPPALDESIDALIKAINSNKRLVDCELSFVLGDINASESYGFISSGSHKSINTQVFPFYLPRITTTFSKTAPSSIPRPNYLSA